MGGEINGAIKPVHTFFGKEASLNPILLFLSNGRNFGLLPGVKVIVEYHNSFIVTAYAFNSYWQPNSPSNTTIVSLLVVSNSINLDSNCSTYPSKNE